MKNSTLHRAAHAICSLYPNRVRLRLRGQARKDRHFGVKNQFPRIMTLGVSCLALAGARIQAQTAQCAGSFSLGSGSNAWTNNSYQTVRFSPDGTKVAMQGAGGTFGGTAASLLVLDLPGMTKNIAMSKNIATQHMEWTNSGGLVNKYSDASIQYIKPDGTVVNLSSLASTAIVDMYPVKGTNKMLILSAGYRVWVLDDTNPDSPTVVQITGFGIPGAIQFGGAAPAIAGTTTRIFLAREDGAATTFKAYDYSGNLVTGNWTDVQLDSEPTLSRYDGKVVDINIRPTDGLVFARIHHGPSYDNWPLSNLVIFNQNGSTSPGAGFNRDDMSILSTTADADMRITFDSAGNIYGNLTRENLTSADNQTATAPWPSGVVKFDPKGNLDFGFMREVVRSYVHATGSMARSFDVNPATGLVAIINNFGFSGDWALDPAHRRHGIEQVEHWTDNRANYTGPYKHVHFWFNSGLLVRPNIDSGVAAQLAAQNCGIQPVSTLPVTEDATGTIDCAKTAFMPAPVPGTAQQLSVLVTLNVTEAGSFNPVTMTGSGLSVPAGFSITTSSTGVQQFVIPVNYSGAALGSFDLTVGDAGTCTGNLANTPTSNTKEAQIRIWTVDNCTYKLAGPALK